MIRKLIWPVLIGAGLLLFTQGAVEAVDRYWPRHTAVPDADVIVCLGAGVSDTTGELGPNSQQRVETCVDLYLAGKAPKLAFTGAASESPIGDVATQMADYARTRGVPEQAMVVEPNSESTLQNALFTLPMLDNPASVILVSDAFHLPRSWISFKLVGARDITLVATSSHAAAAWKRRETLAIWFNLARFPVYLAADAFGVANAETLLH
jgi:uncharacterized SAM-binding protein YcdF (DUF218 family)